ncbi:MAG: S9 family peptidase [Candidatus Sulfotelmatobacter sp.]|jgi:dipeptidyl aminopeptidase/acylaminoacyl peptidase
MRRLFLLLVALAASASSVVGQAKHPFTFEDMMKLKRVGEPEVSPDGKWVIFSVVDVDLEANTKTPHIWIVPLDHVGTAAPGRPAEQSSAGSSSAERILIADQDGDRPRWAPDGKRFAFLSTKEGGSQVWIADFDGAAGIVTGVHKLTSIATEAGGELWSPDGKHILFTSDVYPECDGKPDAEAECNAKKVKETAGSKVKALIFERLLYRHWNAYEEGKRSHILVTDACVGTAASAVRPGEAGQRSSAADENSRAALDPTAGGGCRYIDLTPGDYDSPEFSLGGQDDYAFSPDGQEICYTSNHDKVEATSTNNDLWIVPVNAGGMISGNRLIPLPPQAKNITADNPASDSTPLYSPDGRYIAYRAQQRPGYESDRFRLMLYDRKTGEKRNLTIGAERMGWVGTYTWTPDSSKIYFVSEVEGASYIWSEELPQTTMGRSAIQLVSGGFNDDLAFDHGGNILVFTRMSIRRPNEIYKIVLSDWGTKTAPDSLQLTHIDDTIFSRVQMEGLEPFWFPGAHGDKVEGFLVKPPNFDATKKYPVKFLVHGGPQGAWGDDWSYRWNPELFAANGYVVVMINFHGSTGYGQKFVDSINGDWGGGPFEDLMKGLDYAEEHYPFIDKNRECALGASFGGYMINWIAGHTDRFKCLVSHDGSFNNESDWATTDELWFNDWEFHGTPYDNRDLYLKWSPHMYAKNFKTPTLVVHGQLDYRLDVSEGFQMFDTLQMMGVPSKMLYFPDEGHWVLKPQNARLWYKTVNDWVDQWTK